MKRIQSIDALRGLCVLLMVAHHFLYDLVVFMGLPAWLFTNPVFDILHYIFAGCFILLSGVSSRFSHSNVLRGLKVIAAAIAVSVVTYFMDMVVMFGILHFLGFAMVFYGLTQKLWKRLPDWLMPTLCVVLLVGSALFLNYSGVSSRWLWPLGITYEGFYSADYFPILPWLFVFLFGTWLGGKIREGRFPRWFYEIDPPLLPQVGRHAFIVYLVHQPVLYGLTLLLKLIFGK